MRAYDDTPLICSIARLWRSVLHTLPDSSVTLDLRWSHIAVSDDMDPLSSASHHRPHNRHSSVPGSHGSHSSVMRGGGALPVPETLPVWFLAEIAQGVCPLAVTDLLEMCDRLQLLKSVSVAMLTRVSH